MEIKDLSDILSEIFYQSPIPNRLKKCKQDTLGRDWHTNENRVWPLNGNS